MLKWVKNYRTLALNFVGCGSLLLNFWASTSNIHFKYLKIVYIPYYTNINTLQNSQKLNFKKMQKESKTNRNFNMYFLCPNGLYCRLLRVHISFFGDHWCNRQWILNNFEKGDSHWGCVVQWKWYLHWVLGVC